VSLQDTHVTVEWGANACDTYRTRNVIAAVSDIQLQYVIELIGMRVIMCAPTAARSMSACSSWNINNK